MNFRENYSDAKRIRFDEVVYSSFYKYGKKWVISSSVVNVSMDEVFTKSYSTTSIEDMERLIFQLVKNITKWMPPGKQGLGKQIQKPAHSLSHRKRAPFSLGSRVGYTIPANASSFPITYTEGKADYLAMSNLGDFAQTIDFFTWVDFPGSGMAANMELKWTYFDRSIGADFNLIYLLGNYHVRPFVGGGLGWHYVKSYPKRDRSGLGVNWQAGSMLYNSKNVRIMLNTQYHYIFNDNRDQVFRVGLGLVGLGLVGNGSRQSGNDSATSLAIIYGLVTMMIMATVWRMNQR